MAEYLAAWLEFKAFGLKPTTMVRYTDYVHNDLIPAVGALRLEELSHHHVAEFIRRQLDAGRGLITLHRCVATLSSSLNDAVKQHRLMHNPARYATVPRPPKRVYVCWSPAEAARFLRYCRAVDDPLTDLYEIVLGTGMRRGEALGLHWADVDIEARVLFVRYTLSMINNSVPVFTKPKTKSSYAWIGLSDRVAEALTRQAERTRGRPGDLVFSRPDGQPLRPEYVLRHLQQLARAAGVPRVRVHDLRHFAATTMLASQVPLAMASKTMRHSTLSTTTEIYGHLLRHVAQQAVASIDAALTDAENSRRQTTTTVRPHLARPEQPVESPGSIDQLA
ncbi:Site-specific recombinase XerD [Pseudonocardia oroxyli]|uniref:Site-specific recombinase XerD n=1 Tax=Pseudonocardia oroxyli TaxID=366584 RepID=A0A1G7TGV2_PSEOR|nr:Site-specific recombinase XerD [Pseudonocardia oroxyli]